jgi:thiamine-phosphate pyrophosphorylase
VRPRHPASPKTLPRLWLMTDERVGTDLFAMLETLPAGAGIIFRHYVTPPAERRALFAAIAAIARRRRLVLIRAGKTRMPGEHGVHGAGRMRRGGIRTWPAHSRIEALAGRRAGADLLLVSPVFATRSHPGKTPLGPLRAAAVLQGLDVPAVALGGMQAHRYRRMAALGFYGWAAIDAWRPTRDQKRKAVPI